MTTNREGPGSASAVRHEVEGPRITDALYQAFKNEATPIGLDPVDGLARPIVSQAWKDAQAPDLDRARFVCMGDYSAFVERDEWGFELNRYTPDKVKRSPDGSWFVERMMGFAFWRKAYRVEVEPIRPQCQHYARQLVPFPEEIERSLAVRLCTARRTDEGEFLDLGNQQILACELRSPTIGNEQAKLDAFDERTIAAQHERKNDEVSDDFDVDAALGAQTTTKGN
jgi:hypothetical protein